jgi:hypothetical protein
MVVQKTTCIERSVMLVLAVVLVVPPPLSPATIVVSGGCTLADAIDSANTDSAVGGCAAGAGADTVRLTGNVSLAAPHSGQNGTPPVTSRIALDGQGHTVERTGGSPLFRLFQVDGAGDLALDDVILSGGSVSGVLNGGGAIKNTGTLTVDSSTITGNEADFSGGGIFNGGVATLVNSTISHNTTGENGGGIYSDFGAVTTVIDSEITGNYSFWGGSGIFAYEGSYPDGGVTISGSTVSGNQNSGVVMFYAFSNNALTITNSTISGNGNDGMYVLGSFGVHVDNTTFANNGGDNIGGYSDSGSTSFTNVISAYAGGADCSFSGFGTGVGSFDSDGTCASALPITGLDPVLADNGGPTQTHALLAGSSAIDGGGACGLLVDQRGFGRDATCDSGAFEFDGAPAVGASVGGLTPQFARCSNVTAGGSVDILNAKSWNCRSAGLPIASGDRVRQTVRGRPSSTQFTGALDGISNGRVLCQNHLTGQSVQFPLAGSTTWNCRAQGLQFSADNTISWTLTGIAD